MDVPQLDFSAALSTPEEKLVSSPAVAAHLPVAAATKSVADDFLRGVRLSRSTWTNIVFVAIASIGGLVCAFYFFNGAEVLRAAASWPSEYLYPRPISTEKLDGALQPNPVDQYSAASSNSGTSRSAASKNSETQNNASNQPFFATNLTPPATTVPPTNPGPVPPPIVIVPPPVPPPTTLLDQITNDLNAISPGSGTKVQSLYQTVASTEPGATTIRTTKNEVKTTKRKVSTTKQKIVTTATSATSTVRNLQQTVGQTQMTQMSMTSGGPVNQTMSSGGMGGISGLGGGIGGTGGGAGAGAGAVGGTVGGLGGGLNGGGLGGTISGVGGTVGGVVPHH